MSKFWCIDRILTCITLIVILTSCAQNNPNSGQRFHEYIDSASALLTRNSLDSAITYIDQAAAIAATAYEKACIRERKAQVLYRRGDKEQSKNQLRYALDYFERIQELNSNDNQLKLRTLFLMSTIEQEDGNIKEALRYFQRCSNMAKEHGKREIHIDAQLYIHNQQYKLGQYAEAIEGLQQLLEYCDTENIGGTLRFRTLNALYEVYFALNDVESAKQYISMMEDSISPDDIEERCIFCTSLYYLSDSIKNVAIQRQCIDTLSVYVENPKLSREENVEALQALSLHCIKTGEFNNAKEYLNRLNKLESKVAKENRSLKSEMMSVRYFIASKQLDSAQAILNNVDVEFYKLHDLMQYTSYLAYKSWFAFANNDFKESYDMLKRRSRILDSLKQESISHNLAYKTLRHKREQTILSQQIKIQRQQNELADVNHKRQVTLAFGIITVLIILVGIYAVRTIRIKRHNLQVQQNNIKLKSEVQYQTEVLEKRQNELNRKNKQLQEQMEYASNIQFSMLPSPDAISSSVFSQVFLLYRPCALISGDFYWTAQVGAKKFICVGDATGHGIPGAFIAMVSSTILNDIALSMKDRTAVNFVSKLDKHIRAILQTNDTTHGNDSVDASMLCIDESTGKITISLARHNAYLVKTTGEVERLSGVKRSIGDVDPEYMKRDFEEIELNASSGDCLYLMSDGYESQLGGPLNKKLKRSKLVELLSKYREYSMTDQRRCLINDLEQWMGDNEQTDDVLLVGLRIA